MQLNRTQFFLLLFVSLIGPLVACKIYWISHSKQTTGMVYFIGHTLELQGGISDHRVILFKTENDSFTFNAGIYGPTKPGDPVPILYQENDPHDARENIPSRIWGDTFVFSLIPILVLFVIFSTPDRLDPLIPKRSKIVLGKNPFIRIVQQINRNLPL
jgi:hypothetical protein